MKDPFDISFDDHATDDADEKPKKQPKKPGKGKAKTKDEWLPKEGIITMLGRLRKGKKVKDEKKAGKEEDKSSKKSDGGKIVTKYDRPPKKVKEKKKFRTARKD